MNIYKSLDLINKKISGLCTLVVEKGVERQGFTNKNVFIFRLYQVNYPDTSRKLLKEFKNTGFDDLEADIFEYLFDILISGEYKK